MRRRIGAVAAMLLAGLAAPAAARPAAARPAAARPAAHHPRPAANIAVIPVSRMAEPWWRDRFEAKRRELAAHPPTLVWLGDSITQNWESDGPQPFRRFLPVWRHFYGDRDAIDLGFKGDSTCHLLWRIDHGELDGIAPRAVVLLIGANNFGHIHTDAAQTFDGIVAVLDRVHARLPDSRILLLGVLPSIRSAWVTSNTRALDAMLAARIASGRPYLDYRDVGDLFLSGGRVDPADYLDPLLSPPAPPLHPTPASQSRIASAIEPVLAGMLGDRPHPPFPVTAP